jgi:hypothetical protein
MKSKKMPEQIYLPKWTELLVALYNIPEEQRYCGRLHKRTGITIRHIRDLVNNLERMGIVTKEGKGKIKYIRLNDNNRNEIKQKCRLWQNGIIRKYMPEKYNLKIDGCFDLSRIKKVIGTWSVKGTIHRQSRFVKEGEASDKVRGAILSLSLINHLSDQRIIPTNDIPDKFIMLLRTNPAIQDLWLSPNDQGDKSAHDWMLGCELAMEGLNSSEIACVLMINPFGKFQRDRRVEYIQNTVRNLIKSG